MHHAQNPVVGEEFWSTTTIEVDPADLRVSTIHPSSWDLDQHGVGSSHNAAESANHGNFAFELCWHMCITGMFQLHVRILQTPLPASTLIFVESPVFGRPIGCGILLFAQFASNLSICCDFS
jgi:hypothetical protein